MSEYTFEIAEWKVRICFVCEDNVAGMHLLPSFEPFRSDSSVAEELFCMTVDQQMTPIANLEHVKVCETGNGDIVVDKLKDGGYQYLVKNLRGDDCALMQSDTEFKNFRCRVLNDNEDLRAFGLNNCMMMAYAFAGALQGTLLIHASLVRHKGFGYAFVAKSGTGKSTQTQNWLKMIQECDLMNDDNPVLRYLEGQVIIYGSPWSGKTPCYRQVKAPVGAITKISRHSDNFVERMPPLMAFNALISSCSVMKWDTSTYRGVCNTVSAIVENVKVFTLHCTADPESAVVCHKAIGKN